jgi:hypothetical protein
MTTGPGTSPDTYLTADRVRGIYSACWRPNGAGAIPNHYIVVEGWLGQHTFNINRLHAHREEIIRMLLSLPAGFRADVGEGGSVGAMIQRGDGSVWSTDMKDIEALVALGMATGLTTFCAPREKWHLLPGELPYVRVEITKFGVSVN